MFSWDSGDGSPSALSLYPTVLLQAGMYSRNIQFSNAVATAMGGTLVDHNWDQASVFPAYTLVRFNDGWLIVLGREGILNNLLGLAGFGPYRMIYNTPSLIFGLVQYMLPFAVLLIAPAVTAIEEELELASESLGADWKRTFVHVTLPLARPGLVAAAVVVFALTLTDYAMPVVLGGGTNDFIANAVYDAFFRISDNGLGSALAIALVLFGSTLVGFLLTLLGAGTLGMSGRGRG
jgi:putative spermidine/putrescine transport system permease protein